MAELRYSESHEWLRVEDGIATIGITKYAAEQLGDVVFVELPERGKKLAAGAEASVVESVKAASEIYAPVKGTVVEANNALTNNPALINTDPFGEGWIFAVKIDNPDDLKNLQSAAAYKDQIET